MSGTTKIDSSTDNTNSTNTTDNTTTDNTVSGGFCGIDDRTFISNSDSGKMEFTFGIRFYPWGAAPFSEDKLKNTKNSFFSAEEHFSKLTRKIKTPCF